MTLIKGKMSVMTYLSLEEWKKASIKITKDFLDDITFEIIKYTVEN
jgi:hypothetical protein